MTTQEEIMKQGGYIRANVAADTVGANLSSIYHMVETRKLHATKVGKFWYVSVKSLLEEFKHVEPIVDRIRALGVEPNDEQSTPTKKGGGRGRSPAGR